MLAAPYNSKDFVWYTTKYEKMGDLPDAQESVYCKPRWPYDDYGHFYNCSNKATSKNIRSENEAKSSKKVRRENEAACGNVHICTFPTENSTRFETIPIMEANDGGTTNVIDGKCLSKNALRFSDRIKENQRKRQLEAKTKAPHWNPSLDVRCPIRSVLGEAISRWVNDIKIPASPEVDFISTSVKSIVESTVKSMASNDPICAGAYVIPFGSMAEKTRILQADEYDFLIALPVLSDPEFTNLHCTLKQIRIYFLQEHARRLIGVPGMNYYDHYYNMLLKLQGVFEKTVNKHFPPGYKFADYENGHVGQTITLHLEYKGQQPFVKCREISVDICFCIPLTVERINSILIKTEGDEILNAEFLRHLQIQFEREDAAMLAIITQNNMCDRYSFLSQISEFQQGSPVTNCYMLAKFICRTFLPKVEKPRQNCHLCVESLISSYSLKTSVLYLTDNYKDRRQWDRCQLGNRLIEVFEILRFTLHVQQYAQEQGISKNVLCDYKLPFLQKDLGSQYFEYSPKEGVLKVKTNRFGGKKCFIPSLIDMEKAIETTAHPVVKSYWEYLNNEPWTLVSVLEKLTSLLYMLKSQHIFNSKRR